MKHLLLLLNLLFTLSAHAQFQTNGVATNLGGGVYQLTPATNAVFGAIWYKLQHNLNNPFNVQGQINLGSDIGGADGITFVMQNNCLASGGSGGGVGYSGMPGQSIGIEFDTYQNIAGTGTELNNDPVFDHIAVEKNGDVVHDASANDITAPVQMDPVLTNVKSGAWYNFQINYNPTTKLLKVYFNGSLRVSVTYDIKANVFGGNQWVYWGFTSSTGGHNNIQQIAINSTLTTHLLTDTAICTGSIPIVLDPLTNLRGTNLAAGNPSSASFDVANSSLAFDGIMATRWSGAMTDNEWIYVDLQSPTNIDSVTLDWEAAYATNYLIQTSNDAITWTTPPGATVIGGNGAHDKIVFSATNVRYVKMQSTLRGFPPYGPSLWEFRVYGQPNYLWSTNNSTNATISPNIYSSSVTLTPTVTTIYSVMIPDACLGFTSYSMTVTISCSAPVKLIDFTAKPNNQGIQLHWSTASEHNSSFFEILKSTDGINFQIIGYMPASGNSSSVVSYDFPDKDKLSEEAYYKLITVDFDGSKEDSEIKHVREENHKPFIPSPIFENETDLILPGNLKWIEYSIVDMLGRTLYNKTLQNPPASILIGQDLPTAGYIVIVKTDLDLSAIKICKQR